MQEYLLLLAGFPLLLAILLFFLFPFTGKRHSIDSLEGVCFVCLHGAYIGVLILQGES